MKVGDKQSQKTRDELIVLIEGALKNYDFLHEYKTDDFPTYSRLKRILQQLKKARQRERFKESFVGKIESYVEQAKADKDTDYREYDYLWGGSNASGNFD